MGFDGPQWRRGWALAEMICPRCGRRVPSTGRTPLPHLRLIPGWISTTGSLVGEKFGPCDYARWMPCYKENQ